MVSAKARYPSCGVSPGGLAGGALWPSPCGKPRLCGAFGSPLGFLGFVSSSRKVSLKTLKVSKVKHLKKFVVKPICRLNQINIVVIMCFLINKVFCAKQMGLEIFRFDSNPWSLHHGPGRSWRWIFANFMMQCTCLPENSS